ncbi:hypothetical protein BVY02_01455 [bacterium J17]|nr:hypothetical protein BVY02_01455 [bacterium J17]
MLKFASTLNLNPEGIVEGLAHHTKAGKIEENELHAYIGGLKSLITGYLKESSAVSTVSQEEFTIS